MFKMMFTVLPFLIAVLLIPAFVIPARVKTRMQAVWAMVFLFCASEFLCFETFGGDMFAPELPDKAIWFWNWAYSGMCALLVLSLLMLPVRFFLARRIWSERWRTVWFAGLPILAWTMSAIGVYNGYKVPELKEIAVEYENLPDGLDGYKIVHITDIHASSAQRRWRTQAIVDLANSVKPDLICVTGDLSDGYSFKRKRDLEPIEKLEAVDGVYFTTGNHEYYFDAINWKMIFSKWGLRFLENRCVFPRPDLAVGGVNDVACERVRDLSPDPGGVFAMATNGEFRVLLQHRPAPEYDKIYSKSYSYCADLQLSGHTHGGIMPGLRYAVKRSNGGLVKGLYRKHDGSAVYVSPGAGQWAGFPVRFFNDGEITVIRLVKRNKIASVQRCRKPMTLEK